EMRAGQGVDGHGAARLSTEAADGRLDVAAGDRVVTQQSAAGFQPLTPGADIAVAALQRVVAVDEDDVQARPCPPGGQFRALSAERLNERFHLRLGDVAQELLVEAVLADL